MTSKNSNALDNAIVPPAEAGTSNRLTCVGKLEAVIQQGMKELEEMVK